MGVMENWIWWKKSFSDTSGEEINNSTVFTSKENLEMVQIINLATKDKSEKTGVGRNILLFTSFESSYIFHQCSVAFTLPLQAKNHKSFFPLMLMS